MIPSRYLSSLWEKKLSTKNSDIPFLCIKVFDTPKFLKQLRVYPRKFSSLWDKKFSKEKRDTPNRLRKIFRFLDFYTGRVLLRNFLVLKLKTSDGTSWHPPLCIIFLDAQNFLKHRRVPPRNLLALSAKNIPTEKKWYSFHRHKNFRYQKFSETLKASPTKFFSTVRPKNFDRRPWYTPSYP